ncbi:LapA family protein [Nocardia sp. alder85J]|uniref:LapA family protein n=1 Tax=Nocardia sp. alder85J TaxID=2862949 RepID=UPI001CD3B5A5|nr:lipopolysaccharide assembly protein LapA domain-containing protein [Nocardia sp. alder85J]MCX4094136.1 lipopolysaccharide assembly protein LapA domain-containing protein [Nocardia sp. alder85J]
MTSNAASGPDPVPGDAPSTPAPEATPAATTAPAPATDTAPVTTTTRPPADLGTTPPNLTSRVGFTWTALIAAAVVGVLLLIFILQNPAKAQITLFFWTLTMPLGVTILLSGIAGALVMGLVSGWRIMQLRRVVKKG